MSQMAQMGTLDDEDKNRDDEMQAACAGVMFDIIERWFEVNGSKKEAPGSVQSKTITKTPDGERNDKTPSPSAKHVSFDIYCVNIHVPVVSFILKYISVFKYI